MHEIFKSDDSSVDDYLTVESWGRVLNFEIDSPWSGSTEEGFGARLEMRLSYAEAVRLRDALTGWLDSRPQA